LKGAQTPPHTSHLPQHTLTLLNAPAQQRAHESPSPWNRPTAPACALPRTQHLLPPRPSALQTAGPLCLPTNPAQIPQRDPTDRNKPAHDDPGRPA
jgi:hypothetical protein